MIGCGGLDYNGKCFSFDKDILSDSKVYSKDTCCFVPQSINVLSRDKDVIPVGEKKGNSYRTEAVGSFKTQHEMQLAYAQHRRDKVLALIKIYTGKIDSRVLEKIKEISLK
jgi:hypothetical protein